MSESEWARCKLSELEPARYSRTLQKLVYYLERYGSSEYDEKETRRISDTMVCLRMSS
jgi:hypothetical protein